RGSVVDQNEIYRDIDVCVVPSRFEAPFGLVAAEAGVRGIPVIATRRGGLPEIVVDGETGFLVAPSAPKELAERLQQILTNRDLRHALGARARTHIAATFDRERMIARVEEVCRNAAERRAAHRT